MPIYGREYLISQLFLIRMMNVGQMESIIFVKRLSLKVVAILVFGWALTVAFAPRPVHAANDADKKSTHLRFSGVTVAGEGKKPQVYYLLNRKRIQLEHRPIEKDFLKDVSKSLKQEPFKD